MEDYAHTMWFNTEEVDQMIEEAVAEKDAEILKLKEQVAALREALMELDDAASSCNISTYDGWRETAPYLDIPKKTRLKVALALDCSAPEE
jgi:cell division septum initiation protein DivIVA